MSSSQGLPGLVACDGCDRHVRVGAGGCPFCGSEIRGDAAASARAAGRRVGPPVGRAVLLAGALVACNTAPTMVPAYGAPAPSLEQDDSGVAPFDAGVPAPPPFDASVPAPAYGAPPPRLDGITEPPPASAPPAAAPDAGARRRHPR